MKLHFGEILVKEKIISQENLDRCLRIQKDFYKETSIWKRIGEILIEEGLITKQDQGYALKKSLEYLSTEIKGKKEENSALDAAIEALDSETTELSKESITAIVIRINQNIDMIQRKESSIAMLLKMVQKPIIQRSISSYENEIAQLKENNSAMEGDLKRFAVDKSQYTNRKQH